MKQNFDNLYEIDHDYDNESIQNKYYESSLEYLKKYMWPTLIKMLFYRHHSLQISFTKQLILNSSMKKMEG